MVSRMTTKLDKLKQILKEDPNDADIHAVARMVKEIAVDEIRNMASEIRKKTMSLSLDEGETGIFIYRSEEVEQIISRTIERIQE